MFPGGHQDYAQATGKIAAATGGDELGRFVAATGKEEKAHRLLADIYGRFTEGFDTKDLQEAKAL
jgi:hypothetical protein